METNPNKTAFCKKLTRRLTDYRLALGYNSHKVRDETLIDVNKIENNESNLSVFTLYTLLKYYGKSMSEFFGELEGETMGKEENQENQVMENYSKKQ